MKHSRILALGAHPDDCDIKAGGCAALWAQAGCAVRFVSVTNGEAGHHKMAGAELVNRRTAEAKAAGEVAGIEYLVMDNADGQLVPGLEERHKLIRLIREFAPDLILTHRPNDYHPDHRYTSQLVQDCSFLVGVPNICPEVKPLRTSPVIAYFADDFKKPLPFTPEIAVDIDAVMDVKIRMLQCHESQVYEWLSWVGQLEGEMPEDPVQRQYELTRFVRGYSQVGPKARALLVKTYGELRGNRVEHAETFESCEYGSPLTEEAIKQLFPFLPHEVC